MGGSRSDSSTEDFVNWSPPLTLSRAPPPPEGDLRPGVTTPDQPLISADHAQGLSVPQHYAI